MKTKEELNVIKEEMKVLHQKLTELTEEELAQVAGGLESDDAYFTRLHGDKQRGSKTVNYPNLLLLLMAEEELDPPSDE